MFLAQYLLITLFVASSILLFISPFRNKKVEKGIFWIFYLIILCVVTFRPNEMADYNSYVNAFSSRTINRFEPGFFIIRSLATFLGNPVLWGFFLYALLSVTIKFIYIQKKAIIKWGALMALMSSVLVSQDMVAIRAAVASVFFLIAIDCKNEGKWKLVLVFIFCAIMFHYSTIICLVIFLVNPNKTRQWYYLIALLISHIMAINGIYINRFIDFLNYLDPFQVLTDMYSDSRELNVFNLLQMGRVLVCVLIWMNIEKLKKKDKSAIIYTKIYTIGLCIVPLFAGMISVAIRLSMLFLIIEFMLIPTAFYCIFKNHLIAKLSLFVYTSILFYFTINSNLYWNP